MAGSLLAIRLRGVFCSSSRLDSAWFQREPDSWKAYPMDTIMTKLQTSLGRKSKPVNAFAANEDSLTSARAEEFCQNLAKQLGNRAKLIKTMWLFSELRQPELRAVASREATAADLIIISVHHQESLPDEMRNWVDLWLEY